MSKIDNDRVALILIEALYYGDGQTAKRWDISQRTIQRYRQRTNEDDELSHLVAEKKAQFEQNWAEELPAAIRSALRFIMRAGHEADPTNPEAIHAVAGALKIVAEVGLTKDIIDARLSRYNLPDRAESRSLATGAG